MIQVIGMVLKKNTLITISYGTNFGILDFFSFKVCNNGCIMPSFIKKIIFINFYSVFFK